MDKEPGIIQRRQESTQHVLRGTFPLRPYHFSRPGTRVEPLRAQVAGRPASGSPRRFRCPSATERRRAAWEPSAPRPQAARPGGGGPASALTETAPRPPTQPSARARGPAEFQRPGRRLTLGRPSPAGPSAAGQASAAPPRRLPRTVRAGGRRRRRRSRRAAFPRSGHRAQPTGRSGAEGRLGPIPAAGERRSRRSRKPPGRGEARPAERPGFAARSLPAASLAPGPVQRASCRPACESCWLLLPKPASQDARPGDSRLPSSLASRLPLPSFLPPLPLPLPLPLPPPLPFPSPSPSPVPVLLEASSAWKRALPSARSRLLKAPCFGRAVFSPSAEQRAAACREGLAWPRRWRWRGFLPSFLPPPRPGKQAGPRRSPARGGAAAAFPPLPSLLPTHTCWCRGSRRRPSVWKQPAAGEAGGILEGVNNSPAKKGGPGGTGHSGKLRLAERVRREFCGLLTTPCGMLN
ncbi:uncharacterized protein LOC143828873 [Paroedura picta]|uniref:uncharacterized protein LOC143828873 n=1 Tax=Paroedura picta TaxID=143630 RepID=UPI00405629F9